MTKLYFAKAPSEVIAAEIESKFQEYETWLDKSGLRYKIQELYSAFYNFDKAGGFKITKNNDGAVSRISINHFKNLVQRLHSLTTQSKLAFTPRATNSDAKSQVQADFSRGLLEYYGDEKAMNSVLSEAVLKALIMLESFIYCPWNFTLGDEIAPQLDPVTGDPQLDAQPQRAGDQEFFVLSALDVARSTSIKDSHWYIIRQKVNKWDLAAEHEQDQELYQAIIGSKADARPESRLYTPFDADFTGQNDDDVTYILTLIHDRTPSLPKGRVTTVCNGKVLSDQALFYKTLPITRMSAGEVFETVVGDSPATSLISLQEGIDALSSAVLSNNLNFSMQNIWSPTSIDIQPISAGQNLVVSAQKPEALQLTASAKETHTYIDTLIDNQQLLSGINATTRGDPETNVKTAGGQALALAQAIQFVDGVQKNYAKVAGDVGTILIHNLQKFCKVPRLAYIGGQSRASYVKEFTAEDIESVSRVTVDLGSPLVQNISGRYQLLESWTDKGMITDPKVAQNFLRTGEFESDTEDGFKDTILIREENEMIRKGQVPPVLALDIHPEHIVKHKAMASDPMIRGDETLMNALLAHIQQHLDQQKVLDPDLAAILGMQPLPSQTMPPMPPPNGAPGQPEVQGQNLPNVPPNAPPQAQEAFEQVEQGAPPPQEPIV